jgi:SAM-dependent methyltransferase
LELAAELYDAVHRGNPGDLGFYARACDGADRVLELGCGGGRVLAALAETAERTCVGLDSNRGRLRIARSRGLARCSFVEGDMAAFAFGEVFDRILIPYNGLYCLLEDEEVRRCLACVAAHLAPDGRLIFDVWPADAFHAIPAGPEDLDEAPELVVQIEHRGELLSVFERSLWKHDLQRIDAAYDYRRVDGSLRLCIDLPQRYLLVEQLASQLRDAGLVPREIYADPNESSPGSAVLEAAAARDDDGDWLGVIAELAR